MQLQGSIECRRTGAACVTLIGQTERGELIYLTLGAAAPEDLPPRIDGGLVDVLDGGGCRVSWSGGERQLDSQRRFVHRDASGEFYAALPPRPVRLAKRLFFRLMLAVAASRTGRWWLARRG